MLISTIIPCFNQAKFLSQAVDSVLNQKYPHVEILVIDDGSPDNTRQVAEMFGKRIRYINKKNAGVSAARNTGILAAQGDFIHFLDADDYIAEDMYEKIAQAACENPEKSVFHGECIHVEEDSPQQNSFFPVNPVLGDPLHFLLQGNWTAICTVVVKREILANSGLFNPWLKYCEDWDLWLKLAASGAGFMAVQNARSYVRRHPASSTGESHKKMWMQGNQVINANTDHHGNCAECKKAAMKGIYWYRSFCFQTAVKTQLRLCREKGRWRDALSYSMNVLRTDPHMLKYLLRSLRGALSNKIEYKRPDT